MEQIVPVKDDYLRNKSYGDRNLFLRDAFVNMSFKSGWWVTDAAFVLPF
jgi:hypothetical protein